MTTFRPAPHVSPSALIGGVDLWSTSYSGVSPVALPCADIDFSSERRFVCAHRAPDGVRPLTPSEAAAEQRLLRGRAASLLSPARASLPVAFSDARTAHECAADAFSFLACAYIPAAAAAPSDRAALALIAAGVLAGAHAQLRAKKPWNPVLGETFAARWRNGAAFFAEQVSHHPPVSAYDVVGPGGAWRCAGTVRSALACSLNSVELRHEGALRLTLARGVYEWELPSVRVSGSVCGARAVRLTGSLVVRDVARGLVAEVSFGGRRRAGAVRGGVRAAGSAAYSDTIAGDVCGAITCNGEVLWSIESGAATRPNADVAVDALLPSDARFRLDRNLLIGERAEEADRAKERIEELQRREERMRTKRRK